MAPSPAGSIATAASEHFPAGSILDNIHIDQTQKYVFTVFAAVVAYNAIELIVLCLATFKRYHGCYFWSLLLVSISLIPYILGFFFFFILPTTVSPYVAISLIIPSWSVMVTGHSLVLWSRLHLVLQKPKILRAVLAMIIVDGIVLHGTITVLLYGAISPHAAHFTAGYNIMERIQLIIFALQECIISSLYVFESIQMVRLRPPDARHRRILTQLLVINIVILILDVAVIGSEYAGYYAVQVMFKPVAYSVKFKLEYAILGRLIEIARGEHSDSGEQVSSSGQGFYSDRSERIETVGSPGLKGAGQRPCPEIGGTGMAYIREEDTYASVRFNERRSL